MDTLRIIRASVLLLSKLVDTTLLSSRLLKRQFILHAARASITVSYKAVYIQTEIFILANNY